MSRLDELIAELCPNGVLFTALGDLCSLITKGTTPSSIGFSYTHEGINFIKVETIDSNGLFIEEKMEHISSECNEKLKRSQLHANDILFSIAGAIGRVAIVTPEILPANTNQALAIIRLKTDNVIVKYLYYALQTKEASDSFLSKTVGAAQSNVSLKNLSDYSIPVPPLPVQHEIVRILDSFTELTAELTAELAARKKQYYYYKKKLLYDVNESPKYRLQDVCEITRGKVISKDDIKAHYGEYPVYSSQTENNGELGRISSYMYDGEFLTWTTDGANAGTVFYRTGKFNITNVCGLLKVNKQIADIRFLFHLLSIEAPKYVSSGMGNPKLMSNVMGNIKIWLPCLQEQTRIAKILDKFYIVCNSFTSGLPAEISARQKQYEYYRDKLLTFKPLAQA